MRSWAWSATGRLPGAVRLGVLELAAFGKDPVYLDDPSVLMPAPPSDLTAASGALIMDGATSRRALTTAMLDLASRGLIAFRQDDGGILGLGGKKVGIDVAPATGDAEVEAQRTRNKRRPTGPARRAGPPQAPDPRRGRGRWVHHLGGPAQVRLDVSAFDRALEDHVVSRGWFGEKPSKVVARWAGRGTLAIVGGVIALIAGLNIPISGLTLIGVGAIAGGVVILIARRMPAVTMPERMSGRCWPRTGARCRRPWPRPRSMQQVVEEAGLPGWTHPTRPSCGGPPSGSRATSRASSRAAWRTSEAGPRPAVRSPTSRSGTRPRAATPFMTSGRRGSGGGLFSDSGIPDVGGMMSHSGPSATRHRHPVAAGRWVHAASAVARRGGGSVGCGDRWRAVWTGGVRDRSRELADAGPAAPAVGHERTVAPTAD
jgi:hypothetical protein